MGVDFGLKLWYDGDVVASYAEALVEVVAFNGEGIVAVTQPTTMLGVILVGGRLFCVERHQLLVRDITNVSDLARDARNTGRVTSRAKSAQQIGKMRK